MSGRDVCRWPAGPTLGALLCQHIASLGIDYPEARSVKDDGSVLARSWLTPTVGLRGMGSWRGSEPDDSFRSATTRPRSSALATSRCRELSSFAAGDAQIAIVGLDRGDDRFGRPGAS